MIGVELDGDVPFDFEGTKEYRVIVEEYVYDKLERQYELEYIPYEVERSSIDDVR